MNLGLGRGIAFDLICEVLARRDYCLKSLGQMARGPIPRIPWRVRPSQAVD